MKKIDTLRFGDIEVEEEKIIYFEIGIPGFEDEHEFLLVPYDEESPFLFLQSLNSRELAFLVVSPFVFFPAYEFEIDDATMEHLALHNSEQLVIYSILTVPSGNIKKITANLMAPVIINQENMKAKQIILEKTEYTTKHEIFSQNINKGEA